MARTVICAKLGQELPGLERPPMRGELGQRIYDTISQAAWDMWREQATILINHYGLTLADPQAQEFLQAQMEQFLFGPDPDMPEGWTPEIQPAKGGRKK
jgi:Fe-S cluster biosynthesis and repair protein YggX